MQIPQERLEKFKEIYIKRFGRELTDQEANEKASKLIQLLLVIDKPLTEEEYRDAKDLIRMVHNRPQNNYANHKNYSKKNKG